MGEKLATKLAGLEALNNETVDLVRFIGCSLQFLFLSREFAAVSCSLIHRINGTFSVQGGGCLVSFFFFFSFFSVGLLHGDHCY